MITSPLFLRMGSVVLLTGLGLASRSSFFRSPSAAEAVASIGVDLADMDRSVAPGDAFDEYANGRWLKTTDIPEDKAAYGTFEIIADRTRGSLRMLIQDAAQSDAPFNSSSSKVGDFYAAFMNEAAIEAKGLAPLRADLEKIAAIQDRQALARYIGGTLRADVDALNRGEFYTGNLFGVWVTQGLADPSRSYPYLLQGGLGMPDREYYVSASPKMAELRKRYQTHVEAMLKLAGHGDPAAGALRVFELESKMAEAHATRAESADAKLAVIWKREELGRKAPGLEWTTLLTAARLNESDSFYIWHPKAVAALSGLVASEPLEAWRDWLGFHTLEHAAAWLSKPFVEEHFAFNGKAVSGTPQMQPRWKRGVDLTSAALGDLVGKLYIDKHFSPQAREQVQAMVQDLKLAFAKRIDRLSWMSLETKTRAHEKLRTLRVGVGYPDQWQDHSDFQVDRADALGNARRAELLHYRNELAKLKKRPDLNEWWIDPQVVNALNLPLQNALNFPAAILQPLLFDPTADAAHNYGAIGAIIGHEISHSFDDQGSLFDAQGRLTNWWTRPIWRTSPRPVTRSCGNTINIARSRTWPSMDAKR